jgi:coiled-coil domain-containing protein 34
LLSPILKEKLHIRSSTPEKKNHSVNDTDEEDSYDPEKSKNMVLTSISWSKKRGQSSLSGSHVDDSNRTSLEYTSFSSSFDSSLRCQEKEKANQLSPWEKWLIGKTVEEREKIEERKVEKWKKKCELMEKKKMEEEKRKVIEEKIEKWNAEIDEQEKRKREKMKQEMEEKRCSGEEKQREIEGKTTNVYKKWLKEKKAMDLEANKIKEIEEIKKKDKAVEKRMKNEQAFEKWLKKTKSHPNGDYSSYGYRSGVLHSCYDWASYPTPSYINPMPWVLPASKRNKESRRPRKKEIQPVSPPLLFRDYEKRTKKSTA